VSFSKLFFFSLSLTLTQYDTLVVDVYERLYEALPGDGKVHWLRMQSAVIMDLVPRVLLAH
jgi:hypothetical protein